MSRDYDEYLMEHKKNVAKGYDWLKDNIPEVFKDLDESDMFYQICIQHDWSKNDKDEYDAYDVYHYGLNRSFDVVKEYNRAWLTHIHKNPHHWQHWILINDEPKEGELIMDMDYNYILEMICDWWAFSWSKNNLYEIFDWYDEHKDYMKLSDKTRKTVEDILQKIRKKLDEQ